MAPSDVIVASSERDAAAVEAVKSHHAQLAGRLALSVDRVLASAATGAGLEEARAELDRFCTEELMPHAKAEEASLYPAAARSERARLLVDAMVDEHGVIAGLVERVGTESDPVRLAAAAFALRTVFESHLTKENDIILPVVASDPSVSLASVLQGMHELLGEGTGHGHGHGHAEAHAQPAAAPSVGGGTCGCGGHDDSAVPELDVRAVPHAIRHATVFGAFDAIPPGGSMVLVAPHDPIPLLSQLTARANGKLDVSYTERGPEAWRLLLTRG
jgi:uncharacterized protein (DUF2249 family)/iron-sulfur cluster repair protein YtfE (RIC family)